MMLRTTISKIKKVCTVAFVPRLLRGEQRCATGKFEIFSYAVLRKAPKSTKSTDEDENAKKEKQNDGDGYMYVSRTEPKLENKNRSDEVPNLGDETFKESIKPLVSPTVPLKETHCEKCQRIIDQAFGKEDIMEPMLGEQYYSHSVNIEDTRREIDESQKAKLKLANEMKLDKPVYDDRTQFGVFKISRELIKDENSVEPDDFIMNKSMLKVTPKKGGIKIAETSEDLDLMRQTLNIHLTTAKEPELTNKVVNDQKILDDTLPLKETIANEEVEKYVYNQERLENTAFFDKQEINKSILDDNENTISEMVKDERRNDHRNVVLTGPSEEPEVNMNLNLNATLSTVANENFKMYANENQDKFKKVLDIYKQEPNKILQATTAKENEEQLTQKLEHIDETPLVEAQKPNNEGFNVTPRVLGNLNPACSCFSGKQIDSQQPGKSAGIDGPASFDEVAKRCLDSPVGKIDEILLNELEKIGIPVTCTTENPARSPVIEDDLVQMDVLHKQPRGTSDKQMLDLESHEYERNAVDLYLTEELCATRRMCNETPLPEYAEKSENVPLESNVAFESAEDIIEPEEIKSMHPNQIFIYPTEKILLSYDTEEHEPATTFDPTKKSSYYFVPTSLQREETDIAATSPLERTTFNEMTKRHLEKKSHKESEEYNSRILGTTRNVIEEHPKVEKSTDEHISLSTSPRNPETEKLTTHVLTGIDQLDAPMLLGNSKSPIDQKMMEYEEQVQVEQTEKAAKKTEEIISQTPSFEPPRLNMSDNSWREQQSKPEYRYTQRAYAKPYDKPSYYNQMNVWNEQQFHPKSDYRYAQRAYTKPPTYYQTMNAQNNWNHHQSQPKPEDKYAQRTYAKGYDKASSYYPMNQSNKMWNEQNFQYQQGYKYGHNMYGTGAGQTNSYYTRNMNAPYMWGHQQMAPDTKTKHAQQHYPKGTDEAIGQPSKGQSEGTKAGQVDLKQTPTMYVYNNNNTQYYEKSPYNEFCVPDGIWDKKTMLHPTLDKMTAPLAYNRTNVNVSDDIWDEHEHNVNTTEQSIKPKQEPAKVNLPDELLNQQLDPYYVLTCNETCPISPRPVVSACETSRFVGTTETVFESNIKNAEPVVGPEDSGLLIEFDRTPDVKEQNNAEHMRNFTKFKPATCKMPDVLNSLPNLSENVALSELLRRVRERSRIIDCRNELKALGLEVEPAQAKCPRKAPRCPPTAPRSPPSNPVPPPSFGLPQLKPRPRACKPKKPCRRNCTSCDIDVSSGLHLGPNARSTEICPEMVCEMNDTGAGVCAIRSKADLTEEVIDRLQTLGKILSGVLRQGKSHVFDVGSLVRNRRGSKTLLARDYEPWAPIPSWPTPKKAERKKPHCTPGCKIIPPPRACVSPDPPCDLKPCEGFPKKAFSLIDCFAVSLGENKVYDLGEF